MKMLRHTPDRPILRASMTARPAGRGAAPANNSRHGNCRGNSAAVLPGAVAGGPTPSVHAGRFGLAGQGRRCDAICRSPWWAAPPAIMLAVPARHPMPPDVAEASAPFAAPWLPGPDQGHPQARPRRQCQGSGGPRQGRGLAAGAASPGGRRADKPDYSDLPPPDEVAATSAPPDEEEAAEEGEFENDGFGEIEKDDDEEDD